MIGSVDAEHLEGSGLADELHARGLPVVRVAFGGLPHDPTRYADSRTEGYFGVKEFLEGGGRLPPDDELAEEQGR